MLYHISLGIETQEKLFIPRIPSRRLIDEDDKVKRICMSSNIKECIESFPYKNKLMSFRIEPKFLSVYTINERDFPEGSIKRSEEIKEFVKDATLRKEHWVLKEFKAIPHIIKVNNIVFEKTCKYTASYHGAVIKLEYEREIEDYDRYAKATFYHKSYYKLFKKACDRLGVIIQKEETKKGNMDYWGVIPSTKVYTIRRVEYIIPKGISARDIWAIIWKEITKSKKKHCVYEEGEFY